MVSIMDSAKWTIKWFLLSSSLLVVLCSGIGDMWWWTWIFLQRDFILCIDFPHFLLQGLNSFSLILCPKNNDCSNHHPWCLFLSIAKIKLAKFTFFCYYLHLHFKKHSILFLTDSVLYILYIYLPQNWSIVFSHLTFIHSYDKF